VLKKNDWSDSVAFPESLWLNLISLMSGSQHASASFDLPRRVGPTIPTQTPLMLDDTRERATVILTGAQGIVADCVRAFLDVGDPATHIFVAERTILDQGGRR
jgi:hypothetical protein